jgi:Kdo2-lipid IVA lauroyltransferase/acyltransferase
MTNKANLLSRISNAAYGLSDLALFHSLRHTPLDFCSWFGGFLARHTAPGNYRKAQGRTKENMRQLQPHLDEDDIARLTDEMWDNIGRSYTEFCVAGRLIRKGRIAVDGMEHVRRAQESHKPVLIACLHLGNWELPGAALMVDKFKVNAIVQPPKSKTRAALAIKTRELNNITVFPPGPATALKAARALKRGECLVIYIDEFVNGRVHAPFFGRPLAHKGNIAYVPRLAAMTGAEVLMAYCTRTSGCNFKVTFTPPLDLKTTQNHKKAEDADIELLNEQASEIILSNLSQWLMLHDFRFDR